MRRDDHVLSLLAAIVESSDDAIISTTLDGMVTSWNPAAERILGYATAEMIGRPIATIIPPYLMDEEAELQRRLARGERIEPYETVRVRKDGRPIDISVTISPPSRRGGGDRRRGRPRIGGVQEDVDVDRVAQRRRSVWVSRSSAAWTASLSARSRRARIGDRGSWHGR